MIDSLLVLIPSLPLAAFLLLVVFGRALKEKSHWPVVLAFAGSCVLSLLLLFQVQSNIANNTKDTRLDADGNSVAQIGYEHTYPLWTWADIANAYRPTPSENTSAEMP